MSPRPLQTILITGATSDIGRSVVHRFVEQGWTVGLLDTEASDVEVLAGDLPTEDLFVREVELTDAAAVQDAVEAFGNRTGGRLDVLLNATGTMRAGRFEALDLSTHREHLEGNLWAVLIASHAAFSLLRDTAGARIISLASVSSMYGTPDLASYSASKAGVRSFTQALNLEWSHHDIHVCDVIPPYAGPPPDELGEGQGRPVRARQLAPSVTVEDVVTVIEQAVAEDKIHWPVGQQFRWVYRLSDVLPAPLVRLLMRYVSGF